MAKKKADGLDIIWDVFISIARLLLLFYGYVYGSNGWMTV
jgi:hypothetical protein